jgi:hypothetical protein
MRSKKEGSRGKKGPGGKVIVIRICSCRFVEMNRNPCY